MGLRKEQCAEWRKAPLLYCCNQVRMKVGGQIPWNVTPICETSQISHLMGRVYMKDVRKVMQRSVWNDIVSWQTGRFNNSTKFLLHASMTTTLKKKKWNLLENCHMYALKLFWNACTWYGLDDLIFYGQWTNLHDPSQNGPRPVTNAWIDWFHKFIILVNTNIIVMWVILLSNADWDCFRTLTSREIFKIGNPLLEEHYAFLEVIHLFQ